MTHLKKSTTISQFSIFYILFFNFFVVVLFVLQKSRSSEIGMEMDGR